MSNVYKGLARIRQAVTGEPYQAALREVRRSYPPWVSVASTTDGLVERVGTEGDPVWPGHFRSRLLMRGDGTESLMDWVAAVEVWRWAWNWHKPEPKIERPVEFRFEFNGPGLLLEDFDPMTDAAFRCLRKKGLGGRQPVVVQLRRLDDGTKVYRLSPVWKERLSPIPRIQTVRDVFVRPLAQTFGISECQRAVRYHLTGLRDEALLFLGGLEVTSEGGGSEQWL